MTAWLWREEGTPGSIVSARKLLDQLSMLAMGAREGGQINV